MDEDTLGRVPMSNLNPQQFSDFIGPTGSFGEPGPVGVGWQGTGTSPDLGFGA